MSSSFEYLINIQQRASGNALSQLDMLKKELDEATAGYKKLGGEAAQANRKLEMNAAAMAQLKQLEAESKGKGDTAKAAKAAVEIQKLVKKEKELKVAAEAANAALKKQAEATTGIAAKAGELEKLKRGEQQATKHADAAGGKIAKMKGALGDLGGPLGSAGQKAFGLADAFGDMKESMGGVAAGAIAGAAAIAIIVAALVAGAIAAVVFAVKLADAGRSAKLTAAAVLKNKAAAAEVTGAFRGITQETGVASDRLMEMTRALAKANVPAKQMPAALSALAKQEAALGDSSGTQELIDKLKSGQTTVAALGKEMESAYGGVARDKMRGLDGLASRFKSNIGDLFGGLNIEPLLAGLGKLVDMFDSSTSTGKTMKVLFESLFQPLLNAAVACIPKVERFMLGVAIAAVQIATFVKPIAGSISKAFQSSSIGKFIDIADVAKVAVYVLAGALGLLALAGLMAAMPFIVLATAIFLGVKYIPKAIAWVKEKVGEAIDWLAGLPEKMLQLGKDFINGFIEGIFGSGEEAVMATKNVANNVNNAWAGTIQARSPSRVAMRFGHWYGEGFAIGLEDEGQNIDRTVRDVAGPGAMEDVSGGGAASAKPRAGVGKIEINIHGNVTKDHLSELEQSLTLVLERAGLAIGVEMAHG